MAGLEVKVASLQAGKPKTYTHEGREWTTGLFKAPLEGEGVLTRLGFTVDGQADLEHHGGPDKAVCVYCFEHYPYWEDVLGLKLSGGAFGENVTLSGLTEEEACIGDVYQLGSALVRLSQPRQPCYKLGYRYNRADMPLLVQNAGYTGWYFSVLEEGMVRHGDSLKLVERSSYGITVSFANRIMHHERDNQEGIKAVLEVPALSESWRITLTKRLHQE